tara:strand:+ start:1354 stop:1941 length:588 start_codon:yes stop_codon:yes gene_type:complete
MAEMYHQLELELRPSKEFLHKLFQYENGKLYYKAREVREPRDNNWNVRVAGKEAGTTFRCRKDGPRVRIKIKGHTLFRSRIIWEMFYGPTNLQIDHINGDTLDDRIANLRTSTQGQNTYNRKLCSRNTTGVKGLGVRKTKRKDGTFYIKWVGRVKKCGKEKTTGKFPYTEEGKQACIIELRELREKLHGDFTNHG